MENPPTSSAPMPDGPKLYIMLWRAFKAFEAIDRQSIDALGFRTLSDFAVLEIVYHKGPQPVNTIGKKVHLTSGSITTAVDRLERDGLVERVACPKDRRVVHVRLTDAGRAHITKAYAAHKAHLDEAFAVLSPDEKLTLATLLRKAGRSAAGLEG